MTVVLAVAVKITMKSLLMSIVLTGVHCGGTDSGDYCSW